MRDDWDDAAIRRQVEANLNRERQAQVALFALNLFLLVLFALLAILAMLEAGADAFSDTAIDLVITLIFGWASGVLLHGLSALAGRQHGGREPRRRHTVSAIADARLELIGDEAGEGEPEKRKRQAGGAFRLSEEGEILEMITDEDEPFQSRRS